MMQVKFRTALAASLCVGVCSSLASIAQANQSAQPPGQPGGPPTTAPSPIAQHVADLKASLAQSQKHLRSYEWIETTVIMMKGEEKSSTQKRCYYGADGKIQKVVIEPPPEEEKKKRGIRGKIIEKKKAELTEYMKQAVELVKKYVPPEPEAIQKVKDTGNVSIAVLEPNKRIRLEFKNYLVPGDVRKVEMTLDDNRLAGISISTFLDKEHTKSREKDPLTPEVRLGSLEYGTTYTEETVLEAKAKDMKVVVTNSGYRKTIK